MIEVARHQTGGESPPDHSPPDLWDRVVRFSHWGIAAVVLSNEVVTNGGSPAHVWIGWAGLALLAVRLIWGLIGSPAARFVAFPPNPRAAIRHLKQLLAGKPSHYRSHNPAGAAMAYALWGAIAVMGLTGIFMAGLNPLRVAEQQAIVETGNWSQLAVQAGEGARSTGLAVARTIHEAVANLILLLISLHLGGVLVESLMMRRNLLSPMLTGRRANQNDDNRNAP